MERKKRKNKSENIEYTISSGNVYADFGFSNPEECKTKADLAMMITNIIKEKQISQKQAAELIGIDQPKVSKITRGLLSEFTLERLMRYLLNLGFDIELKLKRHRGKTTMPTIHVAIDPRIQKRLTA